MDTDAQLNSVINVIKGTDYLVLFWMSVVITKETNVMVNSEELIGNTEYVTL
jgi:hypothetical protein